MQDTSLSTLSASPILRVPLKELNVSELLGGGVERHAGLLMGSQTSLSLHSLAFPPATGDLSCRVSCLIHTSQRCYSTGIRALQVVARGWLAWAQTKAPAHATLCL